MRILYATDGSTSSLVAGQLLTMLPLRQSDQVTLLSVVPHADDDAGVALTAARGALAGSEASVTAETRHGHAAEEIVDAAVAESPDLLVVGSRGLSGVMRFLLGSVAEHVARHAPCPVLVARPPRGALDRVIVGIDGSKSADRAADWLLQVPLPPEAEVRFLSVLSHTPIAPGVPAERLPSFGVRLRAIQEEERLRVTNALAAVERQFTAAGRRAATQIVNGDPALSLLDLADQGQTDLLVVGAEGLSAVERFFMGSVSDKVVRYAPCSVLVVR